MRGARFLFGEMKATAAVAALRIGGAALSFGLATLLSARLGAGDAGVFYTSLSWATGIAILALWGSTQIVLHEVPPLLASRREAVAGPIVRAVMFANLRNLALILALMAVVAVLLSLAFGVHWVSATLAIEPWFVVVGAFLILGLRTVTEGAKAWGQPRMATFVEFVIVPGATILVIIALNGMGAPGLNGALAIYSIMVLIAVGLGARQLSRQIIAWRPLRGPFPPHWDRRRNVFAQIEIGQFLTAIGVLVFLPLVMTASDVGIVNLLLRIAGLVGLVTATIPSVFVPRLSAARGRGDIERYEALLLAMRIIMAISAIAAFVGIVLMGPAILRIAGPEFFASAYALPWAAAGFCAALALGPAGAELTLMGREQVMRDTVLPLGIVGVVSSLIVGWAIGPAYAAAMPGIAAFLARVIQVMAVRRIRAQLALGGGA